MEDNQTELNFMGEPELKLNIEFASFIQEQQQKDLKKIQKDDSKEPENKKRFPKRFFYNHDYEIFYSNRKNRMMIKNYKFGKYVNLKLSSFILRYHDVLKQDTTSETRTCKEIIEYFEFQIKNGNFLCDFFVNEDDDRLWLVIKTGWSEYLYDITTHFLVLCCNEEYEWFYLLDWDYTEHPINCEIASNKIQYRLLISWIHDCLKFMFLISRGTTN